MLVAMPKIISLEILSYKISPQTEGMNMCTTDRTIR
jgi:hypothetical protein